MVVHEQWGPGGREEGEERGRKGGRGREEREGGRGGEVKYMSLDKQENGKINCLTN